MLTRQNYKDVEMPLVEVPIGFKSEFFQPKYDGIWARVEWNGNANEPATIRSRTDELKGTLSVPNIVRRFGAFILVGEYLVSQQRAVGSPDYGKVRFFDCLYTNGRAIDALPYHMRYGALYALLGSQVNDTTEWLLTPNYAKAFLNEYWTNAVLTGKVEGVVHRCWNDAYAATLYRSKRSFTVDLIVRGLAEGEGKYQGTLGALVLGYADSDVTLTCSGMSDAERYRIWNLGPKAVGLVVEVLCSGVFESGSLRHPRFVRFRHDKLQSECLKPQT